MGLWGACCIHMGTFDLEYVKVILELFCTLFTKLVRKSNTVHCRARWLKVRSLGMYVGYIVSFDVEHVKIIWDSSMYFNEKISSLKNGSS